MEKRRGLGMMKSRVTMQDVAEHAKVSVATVSRVINNSPSVSDAVREKVLASMKALAFVPNYVARSLKMNTSTTVGFMVADISNSYYISMARALEDVVAKYNYNLTVCSTGNDKERELRYLKLYHSQNVAALLINTTGKNDKFILEMNKYIPMIMLNRRIQQPGFVGDYIGEDNFRGSYLLTKQLLAFGHRRIYVLHGPRHFSNSQERLQGFEAAMEEFGVSLPEDYPYYYNANYTVEGGYSGIEHMMKYKIPPTAIISHNNMITVGALHGLAAKRIIAPGDISIAGFETIENLTLMMTRPTVVAYDTTVMGQMAGEAILSRINDPKIPNGESIVQPKLINGNAIGLLPEDD